MRRPQILIAFALVATACSGSGAPPTTATATTVTLAPTPTSPPSTQVIEPERTTRALEVWAPAVLLGPIADAAQAFEITTGIDVQVTAVDGMLDLLLTDPNSGPDIFIGPHHWLADLTDAGIAEPLTIPATTAAGAAAAVSLRGFEYALPIALDTTVQFRNPALLSSSPGTIESLVDGCGGGGVCLALSESSVAGHWPFLAGLGGYLFGPDDLLGWDKDDVGVDSAEALAAGAVLEDLVAAGRLIGDGEAVAVDRFAASEAPLLWGGTSELAALEAMGFAFVVDRLPTIDDGPAPAPVSVTAAWVNAFSADKEAATEFVEQHLALPTNARVLAGILGLAPVDTGFSADPDLVPFVLVADTGDPVPPIAATTLAWQELAIAFEEMRNGEAAAIALGGAASSIRAET